MTNAHREHPPAGSRARPSLSRTAGPDHHHGQLSEAARINTLFGGYDQSSAATRTTSPLRIITLQETAGRTQCWVKNLFELKCATNTVRVVRWKTTPMLERTVRSPPETMTATLLGHRATRRFEQNVVRNSPKGVTFLDFNDGSATVRATTSPFRTICSSPAAISCRGRPPHDRHSAQHHREWRHWSFHESGLRGKAATSTYAIGDLTFRNNLLITTTGVIDADDKVSNHSIEC